MESAFASLLFEGKPSYSWWIDRISDYAPLFAELPPQCWQREEVALLDAAMAFSFACHRKPKRVLQVGYGPLVRFIRDGLQATESQGEVALLSFADLGKDSLAALKATDLVVVHSAGAKDEAELSGALSLLIEQLPLGAFLAVSGVTLPEQIGSHSLLSGFLLGGHAGYKLNFAAHFVASNYWLSKEAAAALNCLPEPKQITGETLWLLRPTPLSGSPINVLKDWMT